MNPIKSKLHDFINTTFEKDKNIHSAILSISSGDGKFNWSGASGIANKEKEISITPETPFFIASITKMFTAAIIMKFYEEKKIDLDVPIVSFLPKTLVNGIHIYKSIDYTNSITIKHLLSHTSGIADYYLEKSQGGSNFFNYILNNPERTITVDQTIAIARDKLKANFKPGQKAKYSDTNYQLLGKIIESVESKKLSRVFQDNLFSPLGLKNTWFYKRSEPIEKLDMPVAEFYFNDQVISYNKPFESSWADGGLISTGNDCLTFLSALLTGKIIDKKTTLPLMHQWRGIDFPLKYGFGTMYIELPIFMTMFRKLPSLIGHLGSTGAFLLYSKDLDLYIAGSINQANSSSKSIRLVYQLINIVKKTLPI